MGTVLIGVPLFYGCDNPGVETAPAVLREKGLIGRLEKAGHRVEDGGDIPVEKVDDTQKYCGGRMKYTAPIRAVCRELSARVSAALRAGDFPLVIGGDHSDGIGILSGVSRVYGPQAAVLWVDSHSDIHQFATSPSGNIHGVPLGAALGLDCGPLGGLFDAGSHLRGENIFIVGLRSYEPEEQAIMERHGVNRYSVEDVRRRGVEAVFAEITDKLTRNETTALHLSFDIDSLDPSVAPGTGINVPGGFLEQEAVRIVRTAFATGLVRSMDISELNPARDTDGMTSDLVLRLADNIPPAH